MSTFHDELASLRADLAEAKKEAAKYARWFEDATDGDAAPAEIATVKRYGAGADLFVAGVLVALTHTDSRWPEQTAAEINAAMAGRGQVQGIPDPGRTICEQADNIAALNGVIADLRSEAARRDIAMARAREALAKVHIEYRSHITIGPFASEPYAHIKMTSDHWPVVDCWQVLIESALAAIDAATKGNER